MSSLFETQQDAFDHMESFAVGDPVNLYQTGEMYHFGTVVSPVAYKESEIFGGKYASMHIKMKQGNNNVILTDKMMVKGSWILTYVGVDEQVEGADSTVIEAFAS